MQRIASLLCCTLMILVLALPAAALDLSGQSRSYLQSGQTIDGSRILPFFEYLDLSASDIGSPAVSFHFGGWLRYDLKDDSTPGKDRNSDLQYAYLNLKSSQADAQMDLGRVKVNEGAAAALVDGAYARTGLRGGFSVAAFGGLPVETNFDDRSGDSLAGGRISQGWGDIYRVGVSYLKEKNDHLDYRKETGVDVWLRPAGVVELSGISQYNNLTSEWMSHRYQLALGQFGPLMLRTGWQQVQYRDYFTPATTSAFRFDPAVIDPNEKMKSASEEAILTFGDVSVSADYRKYRYDFAGDAASFGGKAAYTDGKLHGVGASYHRMKGETDRLRYGEYRVYAYTSFLTTLGWMKLAGDYLVVRYDEEINGMRNATTAVLALSSQFTKSSRISADIDYEKNPYYDRDVRAMLKFIQTFDMPSAKKGS